MAAWSTGEPTCRPARSSTTSLDNAVPSTATDSSGNEALCAWIRQRNTIQTRSVRNTKGSISQTIIGSSPRPITSLHPAQPANRPADPNASPTSNAARRSIAPPPKARRVRCGTGALSRSFPSAPTRLSQNYSWLKTVDTTLAWTYIFKERVTIKPSVGIYNLFNFVNFDLPTRMMSGLLNGSTGSVNGTDYNGHFGNRVGAGTGVYTLGSPRQIEFGLKVIF